MSDAKIPILSQYTNWFKLKITDGRLYKIPVRDGVEPTTFFLRHRQGEVEDFYSLAPVGTEDSVIPTGTLRRRVVLAAFRHRISELGFRFKGKYGDIAYWAQREASQPHQDIFSLYTSAFEFRVVEYNIDEAAECFLVIDPHVVFVMNMSVEQLVETGVSLDRLSNLGVRVTAQNHGIDGFLLATNQTSFGHECKIVDLRTSEMDTFKADTVFLEPRPEVLRTILQSLGSNYDVVKLQQEKSFLTSSFASRERFEKTQRIVRDYLVTDVHVFPLNVGEFKVEIDTQPLAVSGSTFPRLRQLPEPALLFDSSDSSAVHLQAYWGLRTFGPYSKNIPTIRLALLGTKTGVKMLENLVIDLENGSTIMPGGMQQFFSTHLQITDREILTDESVNGYVKAAESLGARSEASSHVDVALIHLPRRTADFDFNTPYYNVKPILLTHGVPSQMVTPPALSNAKWIHANLASAIFAKAGGYPWVLAEDIADFDMILGVALSQAISKTQRAGGRPRYVSYANVFDRLGRWMFFEASHQQYKSSNHEEQLAELVGVAIERYEKVRSRLPKSVAIHYYKRFGRREVEEVKRVLNQKLSDYRVAFVTVDNSHPMRLYDTQVQDGSFPRGNYVELAENELLLSTTGYTELGRKRLGTPAILKISVEQSPSNFVTLERIAAQVLALTRLNHKTLTPVVGEPVTLSFANLVANFAAVFSEHQWRDAQAMAKGSKLNTTPWFL